MGTVSSSSGMALVVPGYFVCAGILVYAALIAAVVGFHRGRAPLYLAFAAGCLLSSAITVAVASTYLADSVAGAVAAQRWATSAAILFVVSIYVFVALYTDTPL